MSSVRSAPTSSTVELHRRLLFPNLPLSEPVPPLLPEASPALNAELYDFIALALRAYVTPWWSKITRYDRDFLPQITVILQTVVRSLAIRLQAVDFPALLFTSAPLLVSQHYADFRQARSKLGTAYAQGGAYTLPALFHASQAHIGIDADGKLDSEYIRQVVDLILCASLPKEDQESECERTIVREVLTKVVAKDVVPMLSQPWFWHRIALNQLSQLNGIPKSSSTRRAAEPSSSSFSFLVVYVLSFIQHVSTLCITLIHLYKRAIRTAKTVASQTESQKAGLEHRHYSTALLRCASEVLEMQERMASSVVLFLLEAALAFCEMFTNRFLVYGLQISLMTESRVVQIAGIAKNTLFPNGYPGPSPIIPSPEEQKQLRERLVTTIEELIPSFISPVLFGPAREEVISEALAPLDDSICNAHLVLHFLDLIVLALFPEFAAGGGRTRMNGKDGDLDATFTNESSESISVYTDGDIQSRQS